MLIVNKKFNDYYDTAMGEGIDKSCVYDRTPFFDSDKYEFSKNRKLFDISNKRYIWRNDGVYMVNPKNYKMNYNLKDNDLTGIVPFIIGFCGKTYAGYVFSYCNSPIKITYGLEEFMSIAPIVDKANDWNNRKICVYRDNLVRVKEFMAKFHNKEHSELFVKNNIPVFVYDFNTGLSSISTSNLPYIDEDGRQTYTTEFLMYNPCLKDYMFYKLFNSGHAFQEIQMYVQGVLGSKEKEMVNISDKDKILQHGFDNKWSFRKEPTKK